MTALDVNDEAKEDSSTFSKERPKLRDVWVWSRLAVSYIDEVCRLFDSGLSDFSVYQA